MCVKLVFPAYSDQAAYRHVRHNHTRKGSSYSKQYHLCMYIFCLHKDNNRYTQCVCTYNTIDSLTHMFFIFVINDGRSGIHGRCNCFRSPISCILNKLFSIGAVPHCSPPPFRSHDIQERRNKRIREGRGDMSGYASMCMCVRVCVRARGRSGGVEKPF